MAKNNNNRGGNNNNNNSKRDGENINNPTPPVVDTEINETTTTPVVDPEIEDTTPPVVDPIETGTKLEDPESAKEEVKAGTVTEGDLKFLTRGAMCTIRKSNVVDTRKIMTGIELCKALKLADRFTKIILNDKKYFDRLKRIVTETNHIVGTDIDRKRVGSRLFLEIK